MPMPAGEKDGCVPWQSGDIVHFGEDEKKALVLGHIPEVRHYLLEFLEGNLKGLRNYYIDTDIREGPCREGAYETVPPPPPVPTRPPPRPAAPPVPKADFNKFKDVVDELLGELPETAKREFLSSPKAKLYMAVVKGDQPEEKKREFVKMVNDLFGTLPKETLKRFVKAPEFSIYEKVVKGYA